LSSISGAFAQDAPQAGPIPWVISGEIRVRPEYRQNFDLDGTKDDRDFATLSRIRLAVSVLPVKDLTALVQIEDSRQWGSEASTIANEKNIDLHQGYLKAEHLLSDSFPVSIQAGRFEMIYGDERLIGNFGWNNVGQSFDGGRASFSLASAGSIDLFTVKIHESPLRKGDPEDADLQGIYYRRPADGAVPALDLYLLRSADDRINPSELPGQSGRTDIRTLGGRIAGTWSGFTAKFEAAAQTGDKNGDAHRASAFAAYVEQAFPVAGSSSGIGLGYVAASGDAEADGKSREFDNLYPTNHPLYGYMDLFGWRNVRNPYVRLWTKLMAGAAVTLDLHRFDLAEEKGAWKNALGVTLGRDATGKSGSHVGDEVDFVVTFPIKQKLSAQVGVARFWPGELARSVRGRDKQNWAYLMLTLPF